MNIRQELFCYYYVELGNATEAAIKTGYSTVSARRYASDLMTKQDILAKIYEIKQGLIKRSEITIEDIVNELARIAFARISDVAKINKNGIIELIPGGDVGCLAGLKYYRSKRRYAFSVQLNDKVKALCELAKILSYHSKTARVKEDINIEERSQIILELIKKIED